MRHPFVSMFAAFLCLGNSASYAAPTHSKSVVHPKAELAVAADTIVQRGFHAGLPPHISTLLGLTHEESCSVMQGVLRSSERTQGIEVAEKNHKDIIIFVVNETTKDQTFYLTSPVGALRKVLAVRQGIGYDVKPTEADVQAFEQEKKMWEDFLQRRNP